jgi:hypothetical protein
MTLTPDTEIGQFLDIACSDCGKKGLVCRKHWGPMVPAGTVGFFDAPCWLARVEDYCLGERVRPLGIKKWPPTSL